MKTTLWWFGGFGFGVWRSVYPQGPIWSIAIGPLTILVRFIPTPNPAQTEE